MGLFFLTSRGSGVLPIASGSTPTENLEEIRGFFVFCGFGGSPVILRGQLTHKASNVFGTFLLFNSALDLVIDTVLVLGFFYFIFQSVAFQ